MKYLLILVLTLTACACAGAAEPEHDECRRRAPSSAGRWANYCLDPDPAWCADELERTGTLPEGCE